MSPSRTSRSVAGIAATAPDVTRIVETLERHVAAGAYGATRPTGDFDCVVRRATENLDLLAGALRELNSRVRVDRLADDEAAGSPLRIDAQTLLNSEMWTLRTDAGDVDVLADIPDRFGRRLRYEDLIGAATTVEQRRLVLRLAALAEIIASKEWADRPKDHQALPELRRLASPDGPHPPPPGRHRDPGGDLELGAGLSAAAVPGFHGHHLGGKPQMARRIIVLAVAVSLSVSLSAPLQATAEPLAPSQPALTQPAAVAAAGSALGEWATRTYGVRFGGLWLSSTASTAHVVVGVVAPTASDQTRLSQASVSLKEATEMVAVSRSLSNLALESKAVYQFARLRHPTGSVMVGVETQRNQVRVEGGQPDAALIGQIVQSFGADIVDATVVQGSLTASVTDSRTTFPPYKAGREVATFMPKFGSGQHVRTLRILQLRDVYLSTGQPVGVTNLSTFYTTNPVICDCQLIGFNNQSVHTNQMYVSSTVTDSVVTEVANVYQGQNVALCKSASTTGVTCGNVTFAPPVEVVGVPATDPVTGQSITRDIENLACGTLTDGPGDSGGPVYQTGYGQTAVGAAGLVSLQIGGSSSTKSCWATMDEVQLADGTRVRTSSDDRIFDGLEISPRCGLDCPLGSGCRGGPFGRQSQYIIRPAKWMFVAKR